MKGIRTTDTSRHSTFLFPSHVVATGALPASLVVALLGAFVSGCSSMTMGRIGATAAPATNVALDVANASKGTFTGDEEKESEALHHFMVGQLSLGQEDFDGALANFEKADELTDEPVAIIHTRLADLYLRFGKLDKARMAAEKAMAADPTEPYVRMLYAGVLEGLGKEAEAEPIYRTLVQDYPNRVDGYLLLSNLYVKEKKFDQAINTLTTLLNHQPQEPLGHFYLGRIYEHLGKLDKAEVEYGWVVEHDPNLSSGSTELLRVLVHQKKNVKAKEMCERILQKDPNNALARKVLSHLMLGESKLDDALQHLTVLEGLEGDPSETRFKVALIQIEKQNYREAVRELSLVLAKNPQHAEARYYLASIYAGSGKRNEAIEELDEIDKESPMYVKARTFAAFILRQDDDLSGALDAIDEALASDSDNINLMLYRVLVLRDLHEDRAAEKQLRVALEKYPDDERLLFNLGLVLHDRGKEQEAIATMERIIQANPQSSDALNYVAYALAETGGDLERAERLARQALEIRSADGYYLDTLGFVQWKRGKITEAEETLARAVGAAGDDSVIVEHYVEILLQQGKARQAVGVLKAFLEQPQDGARQRDVEKAAAWQRLKRRLDELLRSHPEFQGIEKSQLIPTNKTKKLQALSGLELLDVHEGEAFDR
jgi:tetratricopeptide (TPR) repeat protein